MSNLDI